LFIYLCSSSDPVAYRIEPLLLSPNIDPCKIPPPVYLKAPGQELRLHLKLKQIGEDVRKTLQKQVKNPWGALFETAVGVIGNELIFNSNKQQSEKDSGNSNEEIQFPLGGTSKRVDYVLQTGVIDNEYIR
jgi:hypothetical protein